MLMGRRAQQQHHRPRFRGRRWTVLLDQHGDRMLMPLQVVQIQHDQVGAVGTGGGKAFDAAVDLAVMAIGQLRDQGHGIGVFGKDPDFHCISSGQQ